MRNLHVLHLSHTDSPVMGDQCYSYQHDTLGLPVMRK